MSYSVKVGYEVISTTSSQEDLLDLASESRQTHSSFFVGNRERVNSTRTRKASLPDTKIEDLKPQTS